MTADIAGLAAAAMLFLAAAALVSRTTGAAISLLAAASVPQAALAVALAAAGRPELFVDAALILAVKGWWIPRLLRRASGLRADYGLRATLSPSALFTTLGAVALLCLALGREIDGSGGVVLGLALAAAFGGLGAAALRNELGHQATGLLLGEAAITVGVLSLGTGLPPIAEAFALGEVVALAVILALMVRWVGTVHGSADATLLRRLRG